ncbi:DNA-binding response regulator, OmpR family, contains REC and winged-helix (wHTH) domain [Lishizhenia tianjinensis]|uniref:DNA-binding response regulator, OmpR family, contains REC and winged-helix (WHTH) domain n=1 Tax=Lishizhenia tianjinensis TaxID=477690 RepID=A0A1I7BQS6_9FLAO|nr:response regulator transcription factor [Lishizhenia tianjinensis]SFT89525.1 DNA-binding response regulator, OmpR family, contains REC and winged-helix (wHTH) domain [Lishizhenia tianjinensis]
MKAKILLCEDDTSLGFIIADQLKSLGYDVHLASDGKEGFKAFNEDHFHLCIFDVMMPKKDGFMLARDVRKVNADVPILFLTAKSMTEDKIEGFKAGGDDYLTKPFSHEELQFRVKALLKRVNVDVEEEEEHLVKLGSYTYDKDNYMLTHPEFEKKLTKKEAQILAMLCKFKNQVLPREIVLNAVWGQDDYFVGRSLDVFITKLRKYLSQDQKVSIENVHGIGFKLEITHE